MEELTCVQFDDPSVFESGCSRAGKNKATCSTLQSAAPVCRSCRRRLACLRSVSRAAKSVPTIAQTERSSKPPSKPRNTIPRRPSSQERCGQITSYQNRTPYELATGQSDHLEDLVMFEGGAAAKCARPSWISHRSAWRT